ncbi:MAG: hypothetical protein V4629_11795 [Pseudomonadota bacterium]
MSTRKTKSGIMKISTPEVFKNSVAKLNKHAKILIAKQPLNAQSNTRKGLHYISDKFVERWQKRAINAQHEVVEFTTKAVSCVTFKLLTIGFKEVQQMRLESKLFSTVGRVRFKRIDATIPGSNMNTLMVPDVTGEGPAATIRAKFTRVALTIMEPAAKKLLQPKDELDREIANTHEGLKKQWGIFSLVYPLPEVPSDLRNGAARGDRLGGILSGSGMFMQYLRRTGENTFSVELEGLRAYEPRPGFERLGFRAELKFENNIMQCQKIILGDQIVAKPDATMSRWTSSWLAWEKAQDIAMATMMMDSIAIRHLLVVHLINIGMIGKERNTLEVNHPIARFMDPHTVGTVGIHWSQIPLLIGDFAFLAMIFPYDNLTINTILNDAAKTIDFALLDFEADVKSRNLDRALPFKMRFQEYCLNLYREYRAGIKRYVETIYESDQAMHNDKNIMAMMDGWINQVLPTENKSIQNYLQGKNGLMLTRDDLARLVANYVFMATITHENVGNGILQYALQAHLMPIAVPMGTKHLSVRRFYNMASVLLWTSLPKYALGSFYAATKIPESEELQSLAHAFWELIRYLMDIQENDPRLPGAALPGLLERSVNQ